MRVSSIACILAALALVACPRPAAANRMALWEIVHNQCVPAAETHEALPPPCLDVGRSDAVIKDRNGVAQLLEIPIARLTGIEDPQLLQPGAPPVFADAWRARSLMAARLKTMPPREAVAIAINSEFSRSQDQLHLHVDCLALEVATALADYAPHFDGQWRPMTTPLQGRKYWARRVDSADLAEVDPFRMLAEDMPGAKLEMGRWSLAAAPVRYGAEPGFVLLADHVELTGGGHAEDLQDHACAVANPP